MQTSRTPRFLISDKTRSQNLATLAVAVFPGPQSQDVALPVDRDAQGQVDRPVGDLALADLHVDGVDEHDRVDRVPTLCQIEAMMITDTRARHLA
jgi:hypothetical protein